MVIGLLPDTLLSVVNNLYIQYGRQWKSTGGDITINFPITYKTSVIPLFGEHSEGNMIYTTRMLDITTSGFSINSANYNLYMNYIAIGY